MGSKGLLLVTIVGLALVGWACGDGISSAADHAAAGAPGPSVDQPAALPSSSSPAPGPGLGSGAVKPGTEGTRACALGDVACLCDYLFTIFDQCRVTLPGEVRRSCDGLDGLDADLSACQPSAEACWGTIHDVFDCFADSCGRDEACFDRLEDLDKLFDDKDNGKRNGG